MTRLDHLSYCKVCLNRKYTLESGFICNLTNEKASFTETCEQFQLDNAEKKENNNPIKDLIDKSLKDHDSKVKIFFNHNDKLSYLNNNQKLPESLNLDKNEVIVKESSKQKGYLLALLIIMIVVLPISSIIHETNFSEKEELLGLGLYILLWIGLYFLYRHNSELFRISTKGIITKKKEIIPWHKIQYAYFKEIKLEHVNEIKLVLKLEYSDDKELNVTHNEYGESLGPLLYNFIKRYKTN